MGKLRKEIKGFTIIEVVIVLAIAALIIVIVLLAVQALQRSQRTKAMQDAAGRLLSQVQNWESDQGGNTKMTATVNMGDWTSGGPANNYVTNANLPKKVSEVHYGAGPSAVDLAGNVKLYYSGAVELAPCNGDGSINQFDIATKFAISYFSETAGKAVCIAN